MSKLIIEFKKFIRYVKVALKLQVDFPFDFGYCQEGDDKYLDKKGRYIYSNIVNTLTEFNYQGRHWIIYPSQKYSRIEK